MSAQRREAGFTLLEMIAVIVITGIIAAVVAVFLRLPVQQYMDVARRGEMTDIADTALRRISRDLRLALPNSVRLSGACDGTGTGTCFLEFLPTGSGACPTNTVCMGGGRYRAGAGGGEGGELVFDAADSQFEVLGDMPHMVPRTDEIVVYNLGIPQADAYEGNNDTTHNRRAITAVGVNTVTINSPNRLQFDSPGHRFHVISRPVTYACNPAKDGVGGTLTRYWGYPIVATQPSAEPIANANHALLATNVSRCRFAYDRNVVGERSGLVTMELRLTEQSESVSLYNAAHVSNQP